MKVRAQLRQYISLYTAKMHESKHQKRRKLKKQLKVYFRFGNFRENFIIANSIKRHISDVKNSRLRQDLPISINDRVMLPFARVLFSRNFAYAKFREIKVLAKFSEFTVHHTVNVQLPSVWCKEILLVYIV